MKVGLASWSPVVENRVHTMRGAIVVRDSAVRHFRQPRRVDADARDRELAAIVANVPGAVYRCALDSNWTMEVFSDEIERISGYPASDFIRNARRSFASVIHPDDRDDVDREVRGAVLADSPYGLEFRIVREDGAVRWVLERGQRVVGEDGQAWLHGVIFDITARKEAEELLRERVAEHTRIAELEAARGRIIAAQDAARREIERNLHDGAQQQLVTLGMTLRLLRGALDRGDVDAARQAADEAAAALAMATAELRDLARGIHPAVLTDQGLAPAVQALADRASLPVEVDCPLSWRLPEKVEIAAFYFVAECLTNVARYANADSAAVTITEEDEELVVYVVDDGTGGAQVRAGSGLGGLSDRVEALGGVIEITSDAGEGTIIKAAIPCQSGRFAETGN
jgi:PAS domain S-box-containing protein